MARIQRDYSNMRETERIRDAIKKNITEIKDYSLKCLVKVGWKMSNYEQENHLSRILFNDQTYIGESTEISKGVMTLVSKQDENDWIPRGIVRIPSFMNRTPEMVINTMVVNKECLRDHVGSITIGKCTSVIDLEELLKATRYA